MNKIELKILADPDRASLWVRQYYAFDRLTFNESVDLAVRQLIAEDRFGWFFEVFLTELPIGYCVLTRAFDHEVGGEYGILTDLFLLEAYRGRGFGTQTLQAIFDFGAARALRTIDLFVLDHNSEAQNFYHRLGFSELSDRKVWSKHLAGPTVAPLAEESLA
jgi:ribosomal protein S18 acetylase RimI-like enzyme